MKTTTKKTTAVKQSEKEEKAEKKTHGKGKYIFAIGRRKTASARAKLYSDGKGEIRVNGRELTDYFPTLLLQRTVRLPLEIVGLEKKVDADITTEGGGVSAQAGAVSLALSRALLGINAEYRLPLKKQGMLARDARKKERKKPGLRRARRAPQWAKR